MSNCPPGSIGRFPETDWSDEFRPKTAQNPGEVLKFHSVLLALPDPSELVGQANECQQLSDLVQQRQVLHTAICVQAQTVYEAAGAVLSSIGLSTDRPFVNLELKAMRSFVIEEIDRPIGFMKQKYMRARPWTCCGPELGSVFNRPHWRYPGHPSYPSGHATVAWTFAGLIGVVAPQHVRALEGAAAQVARNREVSGMHYPSDSEAGRLLAQQLVGAMMQSQDADFRRHFDPHLALIRRLVK
jgi:hypothetical protein